MTKSIEKLLKERQKLDQMIGNALKLGIKITDDAKIQAQARLVERLMESKMEEE